MGERTFEIRSWGTKDGYSTAHVNWLESTDTAETEQEAAECAQKVCACVERFQQYFSL